MEYLGTNNAKNNVSLVQSDTSEEYETAVGLSQDPFGFDITRGPKPKVAKNIPRRSNRKVNGKR